MCSRYYRPFGRGSGFLALVVLVNPNVLLLSSTGVVGMLGAGVGALEGTWDRLCAIWACTRWPAARAEQRDNSPASTAAAIMRDNWRAFSPGVVMFGPRTPKRSSMAA